MICRKCNCTENYFVESPIHIGCFCKHCNTWLKWVPKKEFKKIRNKDVRKHQGFLDNQPALKLTGIDLWLENNKHNHPGLV